MSLMDKDYLTNMINYIDELRELAKQERFSLEDKEYWNLLCDIMDYEDRRISVGLFPMIHHEIERIVKRNKDV